jgi:thymidylate synthase
MATLIEVDEIADGWKQLVKKIMLEGQDIEDERGSLTKEILNVLIQIKNPLGGTFKKSSIKSLSYFDQTFAEQVKNLDKISVSKSLEDISSIRVPEGYFWSGDKLKTYSEQFISKDKQGFVYTYGNRLRAHFKNTDQIEQAINRLNQCRQSRRAISITWDQVLDSKSEEVPCMILVDFKIRDNELYTTALWRSHDIYGAWFPNAVGLTYLSQYVAGKADVRIGNITIHSISAHIYEVNFKEAEQLLK